MPNMYGDVNQYNTYNSVGAQTFGETQNFNAMANNQIPQMQNINQASLPIKEASHWILP